MSIPSSLIRQTALDLTKNAVISLPSDVKEAIARARAVEEGGTARAQLQAILDNVALAEARQVSMCQDMGVPSFFVTLGLASRLEGDPVKALEEAVAEATSLVPLRQNVINPLTKRNSGNNTGWGVPIVHWEVLPEAEYVEITAVPKGFGSEMRATQVWVLTSEDIDRAAVRAVLDVVEDSMGEPCPPVIIGVGIGGTSDASMGAAKRALLRDPLGSHHADPLVRSLEDEILGAVNATGLGPMGFGGITYALAANVEVLGAHTAVVPVSVLFQCWAARRSTARIYNNGEVIYLTHGPTGPKAGT